MAVNDNAITSVCGVTHSLLSILFFYFFLYLHFFTIVLKEVWKHVFQVTDGWRGGTRRPHARPWNRSCHYHYDDSMKRRDSQLFEILWVSPLKHYTNKQKSEDNTMNNISLTTPCQKSHHVACFPVNQRSVFQNVSKFLHFLKCEHSNEII